MYVLVLEMWPLRCTARYCSTSKVGQKTESSAAAASNISNHFSPHSGWVGDVYVYPHAENKFQLFVYVEKRETSSLGSLK